MVATLLVLRAAGHAQSSNRLLDGVYVFNSSGQAQLVADAGCAARGLVAAALTNGHLQFNGNGGVTGGAGISIGATTCTALNYNLTGTYMVTGSDANSFQAEGVLTFHFQGRPAACGGTILTGQPFSLIGTRNGGKAVSFTIHTSGAGDGSTYAEGPPAGPLTCTAGVVNFVTEGTGTRNP
ncbi:MAG: hypothetical protein AB7V27_18995 [Candidatus Binatia bacterium]